MWTRTALGVGAWRSGAMAAAQFLRVALPRRENGVVARGALSGPGQRGRGRARAAGRPVCVWWSCVVQAGPGLGGCGALECES